MKQVELSVLPAHFHAVTRGRAHLANWGGLKEAMHAEPSRRPLAPERELTASSSPSRPSSLPLQASA